MECYYVWVLQLIVVKFNIVNTPVPNSWRNWLRRICLSCPRESILKKRHRGGEMTGVSWFIIDIPHDNSWIISELSNYIEEINLIDWEHCFISMFISSWRLNPSWVMNTWDRSWLWTKESLGIPAVIKHHEHSPNSVRTSNTQKLIHAILEIWGILLPDKRMQENSYNIEANASCIAELTIYCLQIESFGLPHFKDINSCAWYKVTPCKPSVVRIPLVCLVCCPLNTPNTWGYKKRSCCKKRKYWYLHILKYKIS